MTSEIVDKHIDHGYTTDKNAYLRRLKRIEGQVRGIARMVDENTYCIDILTQVAAVNKALHAVSLGLVEDHIKHCVIGAARESEASGDTGIVCAKVKEAADAIGRLLR
ncbi:metal-sensitive transcriptional regulator [Arthrobacter sp. H14-L1]|uniref:metal-sensitive transcriptional regulator n=1 Tax=Arthrobacter sp. H14-L1 TaxID=2996697 RepID=UPI00226DE302|nr:metal-sensitive transcriptional regulator [Arthrobacter sp. H14-L1]MCY0906214.1 metal-sensitive transcriptional regulator [Arthrobacter sp. H14-L1]